MKSNRREWLKKSLLASSALILPKLDYGNTEIERAIGGDMLRLHWNENPFGPPHSVVKQVQESISDCNLYWDEVLEELAIALGKKHGLEKENYYITSGSTEVLSLLGQHVGLKGGEILTPWPSFPTMMIFGERCGATIKKVSLESNTIDLDQLKDGISHSTQLIFICNPNNPTSTELNNEDLRSFIRSVPSNILIAVDEAYIEFSELGEEGSVVNLVQGHPNLVVCRTFSKAYGCAGFRIGYAVSHRYNIQAIANRHPSFGMSPGLLPAKAALAALKDQEFVRHTVDQTKIGRKLIYSAFDKWGVDHEKSSTNFIYAQEDRFVPNFRSRLKQKNIMITKWDIMEDHIRISIGKPEWMNQFVDEANKLLG